MNKNIFSKVINFENFKEVVSKEEIFISNDEDLKNELRKEKNIYCFSTNSVEALIDWKA